jgi:hypothetical protein
MDNAVVRLVHRQSRNARDIASHARIGNAVLESLELPEDAPRHQSAAGLANWIVNSIA